MITTPVGIKDFRQNISRFAKEAKLKDTVYIITVRNKPIFEVKPCFNETIDTDDTQIAYYQSLENTLSFWNSSDDDAIFA